MPSHDTAAAVADVPAESDRFAYVCAGPWALVGVELTEPVLTHDAAAANFTNELGADSTVRFLRNVTGFWLLQECLREWNGEGLDVDAAQLTRAAGDVRALRAVIDVQAPIFAAPGDMPRRIIGACERTSAAKISTPAEITRCIIDSMAIAIRAAINDAVRLSGRDVDVVHVVGGGVANEPFCQLVADACQLPVLAGPTEAAPWGNGLFQARALGVVDGPLPNMRDLICRSTRPFRYEPHSADCSWERAERLVLDSRGT